MRERGLVGMMGESNNNHRRTITLIIGEVGKEGGEERRGVGEE